MWNTLKNFFKRRNDISKLRKIKLGDLPRVPHKNEVMPAKIVNVYDGDTFTAVILLQHKTPFRINIRLHGIDAPELRGKGVTELEKNAASLVGRYVQSCIGDKVVPIEIVNWDKYGGRIVAKVYMDEYNKSSVIKLDNDLTEHLLLMGYGKKYTGKTKKEEWTKKELNDIIGKLSYLNYT